MTRRRRLPRVLFAVSVGMVLFALGGVARAANITYTNPSPPPTSKAYTAVDVDASGEIGSNSLDGDMGAGAAATVVGPFLVNHTIASATANIGHDLFSTTSTSLNKFVAAPAAGDFFAEGTSTDAAGFYSSHAYAHSGDTSSPTPGTAWTIWVNPTGAEIAGTPTLLTLDASIVGDLFVNSGAATADASWNITTNFGTIVSGSSSLNTVGTLPYSDTGSLSFVIPLGSSFQLTVEFDVMATGTGNSSSRAEISSNTAMLDITAEVGVVPEPSTFALVGLGALGMIGWRRRRNCAA